VTEDKVLAEGSPSRAAALAVATIGFVFFVTFAVGFYVAAIGTNWPRSLAFWIFGALFTFFAAVMYPWQIMDRGRRRHVLTETSVIYRSGIVSRFEVEIPYSQVRAVTVTQGIIQRILGCGDVRISAPGVSSPLVVTTADTNSFRIRSIPDFREVAGIIRERLRGKERAPRDAAAEGRAGNPE
jgi:uncharacterized membrane protein YdbT with pleckstrin-like domain